MGSRTSTCYNILEVVVVNKRFSLLLKKKHIEKPSLPKIWNPNMQINLSSRLVQIQSPGLNPIFNSHLSYFSNPLIITRHSFKESTSNHSLSLLPRNDQ